MPIKQSLYSPLRYPGSKAAFVDYIQNVLETYKYADCIFVEPYAGSAVVSLELLKQGAIRQAILIERDPLIYAFWRAVFENTAELIERIKDVPITIETWHEMQPLRTVEDANLHSILDMGLAGLFYNRTNFSGILKAGPLGGLLQVSEYKIDCRFNKERIIGLIESIALLRDRVSVEFGDALFHMRRISGAYDRQDLFYYIDPPYYQKGRSLYRYWYDHQQHEQLASYLMRCRIGWLVSYDDHPEIKKLYSKFTFQKAYLDYTVSRTRKEYELLISNLPIPPIVLPYQRIVGNE